MKLTLTERIRRARAFHDWQLRQDRPAAKGSPRDRAARNGARTRAAIEVAVRCFALGAK